MDGLCLVHGCDVKAGYMLESFEFHSQMASKLGYSVSVWLIAGRALNFLNEYAAAFGILVAAMTFVVNWYYRHLTLQAIKSRPIEEDD